MRLVAAICSALVPGLGQVLRRRWVEAALFLFAIVYVRIMLAGFAADVSDGAGDAIVRGFALGVFGAKVATPTLVVFTVVALALHALACWDAARPTTGPLWKVLRSEASPGPGDDASSR